MMPLLEPKEITVNDKQFLISKFPAVAGREIITQYVASGMPKIGDYKRNEELMLKLMSFVAVPTGAEPIRLTTQALIDNHMGPMGWETLAKLELAVMDYNTSFFLKEKLSTFFDDFGKKAAEWTTRILTASLDVSSSPGKPPSTN